MLKGDPILLWSGIWHSCYSTQGVGTTVELSLPKMLMRHFKERRKACGEGLPKCMETYVLDHMHLMLFKGEVLGITGVIGSGLSSLANVLSGVSRFDYGQVLVNDRNVKIENVMQAQVNGIFCIRHNSTLINNISILENLCLTDQKKSRWFCYSTRQDLQRAKKFFNYWIFLSHRWIIRFLFSRKHMIEIARAVFSRGN